MFVLREIKVNKSEPAAAEIIAIYVDDSVIF